MDPSTLRWQEEDTCYYCNNGIVDTCEVVRLVHGTREYELHIDESTRSDREGRDIFVPVESDRLHFQHPEADRSMRVEHAAGAVHLHVHTDIVGIRFPEVCSPRTFCVRGPIPGFALLF